MRVVLWGILAIGVAGLVAGCVAWVKERDRRLVPAGLPTVLIAISMLLMDSSPIWAYSLLAVAGGFTSYNFISRRRTVRWGSPVMVCAGATVVLILITEFVPARCFVAIDRYLRDLTSGGPTHVTFEKFARTRSGMSSRIEGPERPEARTNESVADAPVQTPTDGRLAAIRALETESRLSWLVGELGGDKEPPR